MMNGNGFAFAFFAFRRTLGAAHVEVDNGSAYAPEKNSTISTRTTPSSEVLPKSRAAPDSPADVLPPLIVDPDRTIAGAGAFSSMLTTGEQQHGSAGVSKSSSSSSFLYELADFTGEQGPGTDYGATWDKPFDHKETDSNQWQNKCSHTNSGSNSNSGYWFVQFANSGQGVPKKYVHKVRLWNRSDCCQARLSDACVRYSYDGTKPSNNPLDGTGCDDRLPATVKSNTGPGSGTPLMINKEIT
eukprot:g6924.t1